MAGTARLATTPRSSPGCCGPAIPSLTVDFSQWAVLPLSSPPWPG